MTVGIARPSTVPIGQRCTRCRARWKQRAGLCRACWRANQASDPELAAVQKLRRYIARGFLQAEHLDGAARDEALRQNTEVTNALDLLVARLRSIKEREDR